MESQSDGYHCVIYFGIFPWWRGRKKKNGKRHRKAKVGPNEKKNQFGFIKLIHQSFSSIGWHIYCASKICWWLVRDNEPRKSVVSIWTRYASVDFCLSYCKSTDFTTATHPHLPLIIFYAMKKRWHVENYVKRKKWCKSSSAAILSLKSYQISDEFKILKK